MGRTFQVEVSDPAQPSVLGVAETYEVSLAAEAYKIDVAVEWPNPIVEGLTDEMHCVTWG